MLEDTVYNMTDGMSAVSYKMFLIPSTERERERETDRQTEKVCMHVLGGCSKD